MTTDKYKLRDTISEYCNINPILLDEFLNKLTFDDLEVLEMIVEDTHDYGEEDSLGYKDALYQKGYDKGYSDGYADG